MDKMLVVLDIVVPVFNEAENIVPLLESFSTHIKTPFRVLLCYDYDTDLTLVVAKECCKRLSIDLECVKNTGAGAAGAVLSGMEQSKAPCVLVFPADDDYNANRVDGMVKKMYEGYGIVCASRFMKGGSMQGCPWLKAFMVRTAAWFLYRVVGLPTHDPTNGLRLFSREILHAVHVESRVGFAFSLEILVKTCRMGGWVCEVPALWRERRAGKSRFAALKWAPSYLVWVWYAVQTRVFYASLRGVKKMHKNTLSRSVDKAS